MVTIAGCLDGDLMTDAYYDAHADSLRLLTVYCNIEARTDADSKRLASIWRNRADFIPDFMSSGGIFTNKSGGLRVADHSLLSIGLGEATTRPTTPQSVEYSLNSIQVKPGFFFRGDGDTALCFYQQVELPGTAIDLVLASTQRSILAQLATMASDEIKRRNKAEPVVSWDDFRSTLHPSDPSQTLSDEQRKALDFKNDPIHCMSDDSLLMLITPPADVKCGFIRHGNDLSFTLALAPEDQQEIIKSVQLAKDSFKAQLAEMMLVDPLMVHRLLSPKVSVGPGNAITVTSTLVDVAGGMFDPEQLARLTQARRADAAKRNSPPLPSADWVKSFGAKLNPKVTLQNIHEQFVNGALPVDAPSEPTSDQTRDDLFKPN